MSAAALRSIVRAGVRPSTGPHVPVALQRAYFEALAATLPRAQVSSGHAALGGVPALVQTPAEARPSATILYFHGGGYVTGSPAYCAALTSRLARASQARVVSADYRRSPEHPFPAAVDDGLAIYTALLAGGQDPSRLTVAGDSAGGGLALATVLAARERGLAAPAGLVLFSPWLELGLTDVSEEQSRADPLLSRRGLDRWAGLYCAGHPRTDPRCSPGLSRDLSDLPPTLVQYDTGELLAGDSTRFAARAREAGSHVELQPFSGLWHVFQLFVQLPRARAAITMAGAFAAGSAPTAEAA